MLYNIGLMLKLKLWYFGHLMQRTDSLEKTLMLERLKAGGEGDDRGWDGWMASLTQWAWVWVNSGNWWWTGRPRVLQSMGSQRVGDDWVTKLTDWTCFLMLQPSTPVVWILFTLLRFDSICLCILEDAYKEGIDFCLITDVTKTSRILPFTL